MFTSIPAADALARHPVEAAALVAKLASGKSRHAGAPASLLEWAISM